MKIKTSDLIGPALDWAVGHACGYTQAMIQNLFDRKPPTPAYPFWKEVDPDPFRPSTNWSQGGPIIEREHITIAWEPMRGDWSAGMDTGTIDGFRFLGAGPTSLIAAMRCFVASKLGDEVEVPNELINQPG